MDYYFKDLRISRMHYATRKLKFILYFFSTLCALFGAVLIWFGVWLLDSIEDVEIDHGEKLAAALALLLGIVTILIAIFGCVATFIESKTMLISYAVLLVVLMVIQLILVSISYTAASEVLPNRLKRGFDELWDRQERGNQTLSYYEEWLHCCGRNSPEDYFLLDKIPSASCCKDQDCTNVLNLYVDGCEQKFKDYVRHKTGKFNIISWMLILADFFASILACVLIDSIRNHQDRIRFYS